jgi:hypothetical protein
MSRVKACVALLMLVAAGGCANGPDLAGEAPAAANAIAAPTLAAPAPITAAEAPDTAAPIAVVDVDELVGHQPPPITCRDTLKQGSNVHIRLCGTPDDWKRYERWEAQDAAAMVRIMQGFQRTR